MLTLVIGILITIVLGAILFWVIDKFSRMRGYRSYSSCWSFWSAWRRS